MRYKNIETRFDQTFEKYMDTDDFTFWDKTEFERGIKYHK
jgi:hypothetical protein